MAEESESGDETESRDEGEVRPSVVQLHKTVAIVGLMGSGKSAIGKRLACRLGVPFKDSDVLVEKAAGMSVSRIFEVRGQAEFRELERDALATAVRASPFVLSTGGGAFLCPKTRRRLKKSTATLWLRACVDLLEERCSRNDDRPLLRGNDMRGTLERLVAERYPIYAEADMVLDCADRPHSDTVALALQLLAERGIATGITI